MGTTARALLGLALLVLGIFFLFYGVSGIRYSGDLITSVWVVGAGIGLTYGGISVMVRAVRSG